MKIFAISDLHLSNGVKNKEMTLFGWGDYFEKIKLDWKEKVKDEDIVLLAGDFSWAVSLDEVEPDINSIKDLPGKKIIIRGNHDYWWSSYSKVKKICENKGIIPIQNNAIKISNYIFCGTRLWRLPSAKKSSYDPKDVTNEDLKIYEREKLRLKMSLDEAMKIKEENDKVVLMLHYPPFDETFKNSEITDLISNYKVDCVVYGHIHNKRSKYALCLEKQKIKYYLTSCDLIDNSLIDLTEEINRDKN